MKKNSANNVNALMPLSGIILAAGQSLRMGDINKLLLEIDGQPMVRKVVDQLIKLNQFNQLIIVVGHDYHKMCQVLDGLAVKIVHNPNYKQGMSTSLITGVKQVNHKASGILFTLADLVYIKSQTYKKMINAYRHANPNSIAVPSYQKQQGHPIIMSPVYIDEITKISGDRGAKSIITQFVEHVVSIDVNDRGILQDIDTQKDFLELCSGF